MRSRRKNVRTALYFLLFLFVFSAPAFLFMTSAEADSVNGTWSSARSITEAFTGASAALPQDGRVLLAGGEGVKSATTSAKLSNSSPSSTRLFTLWERSLGPLWENPKTREDQILWAMAGVFGNTLGTEFHPEVPNPGVEFNATAGSAVFQDPCDAPGANGSTVCRPAVGACDVAERCRRVGGGPFACPADQFAPNGTACGSGSDTVCDNPDTCNASGVCQANNEPNGTSCNDNNSCTQSDSCQGGTCTGANPVVCTALDQCHDAGICDTSTGACSNPAKANDTACDADQNACTQNDSCQAGVCTPGPAVVCTAQDQCHEAGTCDPGSGICSNPPKANDTACDADENACTQNDSCQAGVCTPGPAVICTAQDQCHLAGTCNQLTGECSSPPAPDETLCDVDADSCSFDTCQAGVCTTVGDVCSPGKVTGGGQITVTDINGSDRANFGFGAQRKTEGLLASGHLNYVNHLTGAHINGVVDTLILTGPNTATFKGHCTVGVCAFSVDVEDNGEPNTSDWFSITYEGLLCGTIACAGHDEGPVIHGNIQFHKQPNNSSAETLVAGAGSGLLPSGSIFNGVTLSGLEFGTGVLIPMVGKTTGDFQTTLLGTSLTSQNIEVEGVITSSSLASAIGGIATYSGRCAVDMSNGTKPFQVPCIVTVMDSGAGVDTLLLTLGATALPAATVDKGDITIK